MKTHRAKKEIRILLNKAIDFEIYQCCKACEAETIEDLPVLANPYYDTIMALPEGRIYWEYVNYKVEKFFVG